MKKPCITTAYTYYNTGSSHSMWGNDQLGGGILKRQVVAVTLQSPKMCSLHIYTTTFLNSVTSSTEEKKCINSFWGEKKIFSVFYI